VAAARGVVVRHEKQVEIRWSDVDGFRHVHHAAYVVFFEEARDEWLELLLGTGPSLMDFVIRRLEIDYLAQARHEDHAVNVTIALDGFGRSSIRTREELRLAAGGPIATARCVLVQIDAAGAASMPLSEDLRRRLAALQEP
jgi:acyl-CoA thioester hydrolase